MSCPLSFLWMGAMFERAGQTARILDMHHHTVEHTSVEHDIVQSALWMSLLRACSGFEAFMKKNQGRVTAHNMVAFLLFEPSFPRSLHYCLHSGEGLLRRVWPETRADGSLSPSLARTETLVAWLQQQSKALDVAQIHKLLTHVVDETAAICSLIGQEIQGPPRVQKLGVSSQLQQS
ncbi:MAG TPA: alpha-E domain-containing protein [Polyangiales bacterium]